MAYRFVATITVLFHGKLPYFVYYAHTYAYRKVKKSTSDLQAKAEIMFQRLPRSEAFIHFKSKRNG